jgi:hypothetical protein
MQGLDGGRYRFGLRRLIARAQAFRIHILEERTLRNGDGRF